jgi:ATP synthase protein I
VGCGRYGPPDFVGEALVFLGFAARLASSVEDAGSDMSEPSGPQTGGDFESRLARARERTQQPEERVVEASSPQSGLGMAYRIATEMVAGVAVGAGIGYGIDRWLETKPWCMIAFTLLGFAAGMLNVFRITGGHGYAAGYRQRGETKSDDPAP